MKGDIVMEKKQRFMDLSQTDTDPKTLMDNRVKTLNDLTQKVETLKKNKEKVSQEELETRYAKAYYRLESEICGLATKIVQTEVFLPLPNTEALETYEKLNSMIRLNEYGIEQKKALLESCDVDQFMDLVYSEREDVLNLLKLPLDYFEI